MGKTQIAHTIAAMVMRPEEAGGWDRGVAYIDSEGAFEGIRFKYLARYWGVDEESIKEKLLYSRVDSFDDVEQALDEISNKVKEMDIGLIVLDSIMDPLKSQYPVGGQELSNLQPRQKHLKRVLDKLKALADIHNLIALYTNHVRSNIGQMGEPELGAQGGAVLGHASDIRILLERPTKAERSMMGIDDKKAKEVGLKGGRAKIVDCGFLPESTGYYLIGPMGIADPEEWDKIIKHCKIIYESGYLSVDSKGNMLAPIDKKSLPREELIKRFREKLYG
ncbi:MAG: hypothetical protein ACXAD7_26600, partial [Candidatus Kariarchaeaceae archaeon]|jgi:RecA/RadA recombinase